MSLPALVSAVCLLVVGLSGSARADEAPAALGGSYLGLHTRSNSNVLEAQNLYEGVTVTRVGENSPAAAVGVQPGDILLQANGVAISHPSQLDELVESLPVGAEIALRLERDGAVVELSARTVELVAPRERDPSELDNEPGAPVAPTSWIERRHVGFEFGPPDASRMAELGLNPREGVEVRRIAQASPLRTAGVASGDVLLRVEGRSIRDPAALIEFLDGLETEQALTWTVAGSSGAVREVEIPTYRPEWRLQRCSVPLLIHVERTREKSDYSFLLGLVRLERYEAGSRLRLLWLLELKTGTWDELLEVEGA